MKAKITGKRERARNRKGDDQNFRCGSSKNLARNFHRTRNLKIKEVRKIEYEAEDSELTALREEAKCYKDQF